MDRSLVISDSHGNIWNIRKAINRHPEIKRIIHLGDFYRDAVNIQREFPDKEVIMVYGNCDFFFGAANETVIEIEGRKILLTHGHNYSVKYGTERLEQKAEKNGFDAILFGHTHVPCVKYISSSLILNPGSIAYPRGLTGNTYAIIEISDKGINAEVLEI